MTEKAEVCKKSREDTPGPGKRRKGPGTRKGSGWRPEPGCMRPVKGRLDQATRALGAALKPGADSRGVWSHVTLRVHPRSSV